MNEKLLKAFVELAEASFERDFLPQDPEADDMPAREERVFAAVRDALDMILAEPELASLHDWVRSLWAREFAP